LNLILTSFQVGGWVSVALTGLGLVLVFLLVERFWATETVIRTLASGRAATPSLPRTGLDGRGSRRLAVIRACIVIAPLLGLLGTVNGMVHTFDGVLSGGYLVEMSAGIGQALHTTQHGLAIAAPGLLAERLLMRRLDKLSCLTDVAAGKTREVTA